MDDLKVGDIVKKINKNDNDVDDFIYEITHITYKKGGSFHDGYTLSTIATLCDLSIHDMSFDNNMANIHIKFNNLVKCE